MQRQDERVVDAYKDVVIIGNGPSGICLSYLLAGNWPHYTGDAHPGDEMLTARLRYSVATQTPEPSSDACPACQREQRVDEVAARCFACCASRENLEFLAAGLEGRNSGKPLSLLMDQLQHPCLDAGMDVPSLLDWRSPMEHAEHRDIEHVVLGKGPPGGAWHNLDPNVLTISLSRWMSLPGLDLRDWQASLSAAELRQKLPYYASEAAIGANYKSMRVPIGTVAAYYKDYVVRQGLEKYFRCGTTVTSVKPIPGVGNNENEYGWLVQGYELESGRQFQYRCKRVVLATGATDSLNRLGVSGEETYNWVVHELKDFEKKLRRLNGPLRTSLQINDQYVTDDLDPSVEPVLIVGSGLSAADAIMAARLRGIPVLHVFRDRGDESREQSRKRSSLDKLQWLPASMYPEYHKVFEMMADGGRNYPLYKSLLDHVVVEFSVGADKYTRTKTRKVTLCTPQGRLVSYRVSFAAVLIGSKPDLSYLQNNGVGLGISPERPIDSRSNPVDVDVFTYHVERAIRKGLYAVGPLAGDNFVRFILGGAFGVFTNVLNAPE